MKARPIRFKPLSRGKIVHRVVPIRDRVVAPGRRPASQLTALRAILLALFTAASTALGQVSITKVVMHGDPPPGLNPGVVFDFDLDWEDQFFAPSYGVNSRIGFGARFISAGVVPGKATFNGVTGAQKFSGLFLQARERAEGFSLNPADSDRMRIEAAP